MSNRILKQSICTSESIDQLDWFEEVFYYRLIVNVDDYGVFDARPKILKASLFPLREVKLSQVEKAIASLSSKGLIHLYTVEGRPFLNLPSWAEHQRVRNSKHKFPTPDQEDSLQTAESCGELRRVAASCGELPQTAESCGLTRARAESRIQNPESESRIQNPESQTETESEMCSTELPDGNTVHPDPVTDTVSVSNTGTGKKDKAGKVVKPKEPKETFGEYRNVRLTQKEKEKLEQEFGVVKTDKAIRYLDEYIEEKHYKSASHYLALRRWVFNAVDERDSRERNRGWRSSPNNVQEPRGVDAFFAVAEEAD